jgi:uncharacterized protein YjiS (DUF1127 family)
MTKAHQKKIVGRRGFLRAFDASAGIATIAAPPFVLQAHTDGETADAKRRRNKFLDAILKAPRTLLRMIARGWRSHRDYLELTRLSDMELQDIGISRSDIFSVAEGTYERPTRPLATSQKHLSLVRLGSARGSCCRRSAMTISHGLPGTR